MTEIESIAPPTLTTKPLSEIATPTSLDLAGMNDEDLISLGTWLQHQTAAGKWWLGDWLVYMDSMFGDMFWQHIDPELNDPSQLATVIKVATVFAPAERSAHVTWDHHRVIAHQLDNPTASAKAKWISWCLEARPTVGDLAKRMREDVVDVDEAEKPASAPAAEKDKTVSLIRVSVKVPFEDAEKAEGLLEIVKADIRQTFGSSGVTVNAIETSRSDS